MSAVAVAPPTRPNVLVALGLVYVIWSSTYFAIRILVEDVPPLVSGGARYVLAGTVLLVIQRVRGQRMPTLAEWVRVIPIGALLFLIGNGFVAFAERSIASGIAAVVCGTTPLWAGLFGPIFGERTSAREWLGMGLGFVGVVVLSAGGELRAEPFAGVLLLLAPIGWALGSMWSRKLALAPGPTGAATQMITGGASMLLLGPLLGERVPTHVGSAAIAAFAYLVIFGSLVAFSAYHYVLANARPALALSYAYVNPVLALVLGASLGAERFGVEVVVAMAIIAAALVLIVRGNGKRSGA